MEKNTQKTKLLILSLGTGSILGRNVSELSQEEKNRRIKSKEFAYRTAKYQMNGIEDVESEFVAEPLIKSYQPDEIFLIGTSKSSWTGFYGKFSNSTDAQRQEKMIRRLLEIEEEGGKELSDERLKELSQEVDKIYKNDLCTGIFYGRRLHVIMLHYGLNEEELLKNYGLLRSMETLLDRTKSYDAAFDITHSFRSLPLYNLVILNYFKNVLQMDLAIRHVYYGNVEIIAENNGIAPVTDLGELVNMLDLSSGISEFKNTGNAVSLLQYIPDKENDLKDALARFDWATQINSFDEIVDALEQLLEAVSQSGSCGGDKFADLRDMISRVIRLKFFEGNEIGQDMHKEFKNLSMGEKQYLITRWYYQQNRYGQAAATGMEALRSYLTPMYLNCIGEVQSGENIKNEAYRKCSVRRLAQVCEKLKSQNSLTALEKLFVAMQKNRAEVQKLRNVFAHNLSGSSDVKDNSPGTKNIRDYDQGKSIIESFMDCFSEFRICLREHRAEMENVYKKEIRIQNKTVRCKEESVRLVIAPSTEQVDYAAYGKSAKKRYHVYRLPDKILEYLQRTAGAPSNKNKMIQSSLFLADYIWRQNFAPDRLQVIFHKLALKQVFHYSVALYHQGVRYIMDDQNQAVPKLAFDIQWDEEQMKITEKRDLMALPLVPAKKAVKK